MALSVIRSLPDDASMARILDELAMNDAIQQGIAEMDAGLGIPHAEVVKRFKSWRSK